MQQSEKGKKESIWMAAIAVYVSDEFSQLWNFKLHTLCVTCPWCMVQKINSYDVQISPLMALYKLSIVTDQYGWTPNFHIILQWQYIVSFL
jgi:hypothetical protein